MKTQNKKAMEMALGTVITIVILLLVLVVVGSYFLGGITKTGEKVEGTTSELTDKDGGLGNIKQKMDTVVDKFGLPEAVNPGDDGDEE